MPESSRYVTYDVVPPGTNLIDAPPDQLDRYGIPQKPDAEAGPELLSFWKKLVSAPFICEIPTFTELHPPPSPQHPSSSVAGLANDVVPALGGNLESSLNWSGALISSPWPKRIVFAVGGWNAPAVSQPSTPALFTHSKESKSLVWVGIDGHNARLPKISLPQIGTGHWPGVPHFAWWDWWSHSASGGIKRIDNFEIDAGNEMLAGLAVLITGDVLFFIKNQSTGQFRSWLGKQLADIEPLGSSVEWIVERPTEPADGTLFPLPAYGTVEFKYCVALAADRPLAQPRLMTLADNARMIRMREAFANPYRSANVSCATHRHDPDGSIGVTCTFHPPT